jgi:hypothetical protein
MNFIGEFRKRQGERGEMVGSQPGEGGEVPDDDGIAGASANGIRGGKGSKL